MLPRTKTDPRAVILNAAAQKVLHTQLAAHTSEWVFPNPEGRPYSRGRISRVFRKASRGAGLTGFGSMTCDTTAPRWRSTRASPRRS
jgi:hypothetical protein